jgi:hypothetical protein
MNAHQTLRTTGIALLDRILEGTATQPVKVAASRGALPVPREPLLSVLVHLSSDPDPAIRETAKKTLEATPAPDLVAALSNHGADPAVLDWFSQLPALGQEALTALVANPALGDETLVRMAGSPARAAVDIILLNHERLVRTPAAVDALVANQALSVDQRRRLLDFIEHLPAEPAPEPARAEGLPPELLGPVSAEELRALLGQVGDLPFVNLEVGELLNGGATLETDEEMEAIGQSFESVFKQILRMSPAQRLRAALRAGREARQILVRDTTRIVAAAVMRNPRLTEEEVVSFAAQKSLSEEILRLIGTSRTWMSVPLVVTNLVRNPKTPVAIAMNHIARLSTRELTSITKDKNIPEAIRRMAKRHVEQRETKPARRH